MTKRKGTGGRPRLPADKRSSRRITVRLYADDVRLLERLRSVLDATETEVLREALRALAAERAR